ncbi:MFS transporter [Mycobacterium vicinigordonae]|uniref:MFS transporter n=1 Tax=Mycobacterium vicinigordonae TaxID=1719132 RepID=A0A7D6DYJ3_9MYCO|nr:MFS transporter [Mycobacterium vicinigordonae]QLL06869.1 MFS transporter [Mycobacterium vicinigordonae]
MARSALSSAVRTPFGCFVVGRSVSLAGSAITPVALSLAVLQASHRPSDLGVVLAVQVAAQLGLLLVGGVLGDRWPRRALLVGTNLGAGLTQGAVAAILLTGHYQLALVACLQFINGALEAFASPALRGIVPELVESAQLPRANATLATAKNLTKVLGPVVAGLLVAARGGGIAIAVDAISFLAAAAIFSRLRLADTPSGPSGDSVLTEIRRGWRTFRSTRWLWATTASFAVINLIGTGTWQILGPEITIARANAPVWGMALSVRAIGALFMGVVLYRHAPQRFLRSGQLLAALGACGLLGLGIDLSAPWFLLCAFVSGLGFAAPSIAWDTCVHQHIPRQQLSRISAYNDLLSYTCVPVGQLLVAPAAAWLGPANVALYAGIGFIAAALAPLSSRSVRALALPSQPTARTRPAKAQKTPTCRIATRPRPK